MYTDSKGGAGTWCPWSTGGGQVRTLFLPRSRRGRLLSACTTMWTTYSDCLAWDMKQTQRCVHQSRNKSFFREMIPQRSQCSGLNAAGHVQLAARKYYRLLLTALQPTASQLPIT